MEAGSDLKYRFSAERLIAGGLPKPARLVAHLATTKSDTEHVIIPVRKRCEQVDSAIGIERHEITVSRCASYPGPHTQGRPFFAWFAISAPNHLIGNNKPAVIPVIDRPERIANIGSGGRVIERC